MPIKHKRPGPQSTELERWLFDYRQRNPSPEKKFKIEGFDEEDCRKKTMYYAFLTMVVSSCRKESNFDINLVINHWWNYTFVKPFPREGGLLSDLVEKIRLKLWQDQYEEVGNALDEPPILKSSKDYQESKNYNIVKLQNEEAMLMAAKTKIKTKTKEVKKEKSEKKGSVEKKTPKRKEPKERSLDKSGQSRLMCVELLMQRKYSDEQIVKKITDELDYPYSVKRVERIRLGINEGKREKQGIPAPKPPLKPIESGKARKEKETTKKTKAKLKGKK